MKYLILLALSGCLGSQFNPEEICLNGVKYYMLIDGIALKINPDANIEHCEVEK